MKYTDSGHGRIPLISMLAILSVSLVVNLPGLAITPVMGKLREVFGHVSQLEIQLLTSLPNLVVIPVLLLTGRLTSRVRPSVILAVGLSLFLGAGIGSFLARSMTQLIVLSCLLGAGAGLVIPLAASLISANFSGSRRAYVMGMKSGFSNASVILATIFVGWIAAINWHMAFTVYLLPILPLLLIPFMTRRYIGAHSVNDATTAGASAASATVAKGAPVSESNESSASENKGVSVPERHNAPEPGSIDAIAAGHSMKWRYMSLLGLIGLYIVITYCGSTASYYLPFTMEHYHLDSSTVGVATSMFFLGATIFGFALHQTARILKAMTIPTCLVIMAAGMVLIAFLHTSATYIAGVFLTGVGYGVIQPLIYNKTTALAPSPDKSARFFSYVFTGNYVAIALVPFIIKGAAAIFHTTTEASPDFAFTFNVGVIALLLLVAFIWRKSYVFLTARNLYKS